MQMEIKNLQNHEDRWIDGNFSKEDLIAFEDDIIKHWENGEITGPIHLSHGNEEQLIEIFKKVGVEDWVFSTWRSHYHALLHGVDPKYLKQKILEGKSITIIDKSSNFYSSAIVTGILPIALGVAKGLKERGSDEKVTKSSSQKQSSIQKIPNSTSIYKNKYGVKRKRKLRFLGRLSRRRVDFRSYSISMVLTYLDF